MTWLHNSCDPWDMVERYWSITTTKRLEKILDTNSQEVSVTKYMDDFPALKKPSGYRLVSSKLKFKLLIPRLIFIIVIINVIYFS